MIQNRIQGLWGAYHFVLGLIASGLFWGYLYLLGQFVHENGSYDLSHYVIYNLAGLTGLLVWAYRGKPDADILLGGTWYSRHRLAFQQTFYVGVAIGLLLIATKDSVISRIFLFSYLPLLYLVCLVAIRLLPAHIAANLFSAENNQRTLLVGSFQKARKMEKWIGQTALLGLGVRGELHDESEETHEEGILHLPHLGDLGTLESTIRKEKISHILLLEIPFDQSHLDRVIHVANRCGARLLVLNNLPDVFRHKLSFFTLGGMDFISLRDEPLQDPINRFGKRLLDLAISVPVVIFILPPLCLVAAILHAWQSPGPLLYRQTRAGIGNQPFRILKFRTMRLNRQSAAQATPQDDRIFAAGKILRRTSLDEMPQFLNVLLGHMSLVGPRPHMIVHNRKFAELMQTYHVRSYAKPGITGLAQISGFRGEARDDSDIVERAKLDIHYIENWSLLRDGWIILKTVWQVIRPPKSAY